MGSLPASRCNCQPNANVRRHFFLTAKDISEEDIDKKVNFEFNNAVKGKPCLNICLYDDYNACFAVE